jgi:hypothetical protein
MSDRTRLADCTPENRCPSCREWIAQKDATEKAERDAETLEGYKKSVTHLSQQAHLEWTRAEKAEATLAELGRRVKVKPIHCWCPNPIDHEADCPVPLLDTLTKAREADHE